VSNKLRSRGADVCRNGGPHWRGSFYPRGPRIRETAREVSAGGPGVGGRVVKGAARRLCAGAVSAPAFPDLRPLLLPLHGADWERERKKGKGEKKVRAKEAPGRGGRKIPSVLRPLHERYAAIKIARIARYHRGFKQKRNARNDSDRMIARLMSCCTHRSSRGRTFAVEEDHTDAKRPSGLPCVSAKLQSGSRR